MFYEERNGLNVFVRPQHTVCFAMKLSNSTFNSTDQILADISDMTFWTDNKVTQGELSKMSMKTNH